MKKGIKCNRKIRGASLVEYSLLIALISVMVMGGAKAVGTTTAKNFKDAANLIENATGSDTGITGGPGGGP